MKICWHVDDLFIGHKNSDTHWLQAHYKTPDKPLQVTCGFKHDYPGMNIDLSTPGNISFNMIPYIKRVIQECPEEITGVSSADYLFKLSDSKDACNLPKPQAVAYHHAVAQLFFLSCLSHDIHTMVMFLTTRVKNSDKDNWGN